MVRVLICVSLVIHDVEYPSMAVLFFLIEFSAQTFCPLLNWVDCFCTIEFGEFFIYSGCKFLLKIYDLSVLSPRLTCLFFLLMTSFGEQKFFILMKSNLSICSWMDCTLVTSIKIIMLIEKSQTKKNICYISPYICITLEQYKFPIVVGHEWVLAWG